MSLEEVLARAQDLVVPRASEESKVRAIALPILARTERAADAYPQTRGVMLGGSFAKGTWIPGSVDIDIFVRFDPTTPLDEFENLGLKIGRAAARGYPAGKMYAQHPYTEATVDGVKVNIVPCFDVRKGEWKSAADRSLFHVELISAMSQEQKNQVRLLKRFMGAAGVYGAEIQRRGFSGYVAEVLIRRHGGVLGALRWFADYEMPGEGRAFSLPDPVDEGRDLGIAVSGESLGAVVLASREFLRRPSLAFFKHMHGRVRPSLRKDVIAIVFTHLVLSEDTLWGELRRTTRHVVRNLELRGFTVARSMAASDNSTHSAILMIPESTKISAVEQRLGPTVDRKKDLESFVRSNSRKSKLVWLDDEARIRMLIPRRYKDISGALGDLVKGKAGPVGASKELEAAMKKSARILTGPALVRAAASARWLNDGIIGITTDAFGTS